MNQRRAKWAWLTIAMLHVAALPAIAQGQTVGLFVNDEGAFEGYTLMAPANGARTTYLINNDGLQIHTWESSFPPGLGAYLLDSGDLLRTARLQSVHPNFSSAMGGRGGRIEEFDWDGTLVWEFEYSNADHLSHHDIEPLPSGNILFIAWEYKTQAEAIQAGRNPAQLNGPLWPDHIVEIDPTRPVEGQIVWEWHVWDHLIQDFDPTKDNFGVVADHPELVDINFTSNSNSDWNHLNGIDYNADLDQIVVSVRAFHEFWVIDHSTTTAEAAGHTGGNSGMGGDLLYRWGNPRAYRRGTVADQKLFAPHDAAWIEAGRPGEGNFLVYNNGQNRPGGNSSSVDEIVPPLEENGTYTIEPDAAYGPADPVWSYPDSPIPGFYSATMSGAERQPNGTTLICEAQDGHFFEVTIAEEIVWDYVSPVNGNSILAQGDPPNNSSVFKVRRYAPGFPGLQGRDLTPGDPIEIFNRPYPVPAGSLTASRVSASGDQIDVRWDASTCPTFDYNLIHGDLESVSAYELAGAECGIGTSGSFLWSGVPSISLYFLVIGTDDTGVYESSWGLAASGGERFSTKASFRCGSTTKVVSSTCP
jgi:hypothetical protein